MSYSFEYLPDVAIADVAFAARGTSLAELFAAAALATTGVMVDLEDIHPATSKQMTIRADNRQDLLYQWLSELLYVKDVDHLVFREFSIEIVERSEESVLECTATGERIDSARHRLGQDVKAVTYHLFEIQEVNGEYTARVVLDI